MIYSFNEGTDGGWSEGLRKYMDSLKDSSKWGGKTYSSRFFPSQSGIHAAATLNKHLS